MDSCHTKLLLLLVASAATASAGWEFSNYFRLGCFRDRAERALPVIIEASGEASPRFCAKKCADWPYFGLQAGKLCTCGTDYVKYGEVRLTECNMKCTGDSRFTCGAEMLNEVYIATTFLHLGCFTDNPSKGWALPVIKPGFGLGSPAHCSEQCKGYDHFGLQNGDYCMCGDRSYDVHGKEPSDSCDKVCRGDSAFTCGGDLINDVYLNVEVKPLGCYKDNTADRALDRVHNAENKANISFCANYCNQYKYFGLQEGNWCTCGNDQYWKHGKLPQSECSSVCTGDSRFTCGGILSNEVFLNLENVFQSTGKPARTSMG